MNNASAPASPISLRRPLLGAFITERLTLPKNEGFDPDGAFELHQALRRESDALAEYQRVLTIFSELILHGTVPDEDPDS